MKYLVRLILFSSLFWPSFGNAQSKPLIQPEPSWVTHPAFDYNNTRMDEEAENGYINLELEKQVSIQQQSIYTKTAFRILSESGVQNGSQVSVNFDPTYNQLIFHSIKIIRGKETINKLQPAKIKVIQQ